MTEKTREKPKHLGKGLQALLGPVISDDGQPLHSLSASVAVSSIPPDQQMRNSLKEVPLDRISPNPFQPRTTWDEQGLGDLAASIKANGIVQPVIVRPTHSGYELIAGERRCRAARLAGLETIAAIVRAASNEELLELALIENIHRSNLNPIERAKAYQNFLSTFSLTQAQAAQRLGEDRSVIANYLRLLDLPQEIRRMLIDGKLTMGHARAILALPTDQLRQKLANRAIAGRLSVREVERLVRGQVAASGTAKPAERSKAPHIVDLEARLSSALGTKVAIDARKNGHRGRIIIDFYSLDEFDRIAERMGLAATEDA
jgi:ParB family chromosome partitioning protein